MFRSSLGNNPDRSLCTESCEIRENFTKVVMIASFELIFNYNRTTVSIARNQVDAKIASG